MSTAACPKCHDEVTIPPGAPRHAQVRCPWCREEFELAAVLDRLPPMLEVIGAPTIAPSANGEEAGFGFAGQDDGPASASPANASFDFSGGGAATATAPAPARPRTAKTATTARPKRKQKSAVGEVIKVALGGIVGLFLAQLILWWLPGDWRRDPLELGPTVGAYAPWIVPAEYRPGGGSGSAAGGDSQSSTTPGQVARQTSEFTYGNQATRNTAGGDLAQAFQANVDRSNAPQNNAPQNDASQNNVAASNQGGAGLSLGPDLGAEALNPANDPGLPTLPDSALEIPEPDLSLDPGADLENTLASAAPSQQEMPEDPLAPSPPAPSEPPKTEESPAEPAAPAEAEQATDAFVGVTDAQMYVRDEAAKSLEDAVASEQAYFAAGSDAAEEAAQKYYTALTDLAEKLTYADPNDPKIDEIAEAAKAALAQGNIRERAMTLITHGPARLSSPKENRPNSGIVLFGRVQSVEKQGALYETRLEMPGGSGPAVVPIFGEEEPGYKSGAQVIVLGTLVDEPKKRLAGYSGNLPSVVWMGETVVLRP